MTEKIRQEDLPTLAVLLVELGMNPTIGKQLPTHNMPVITVDIEGRKVTIKVMHGRFVTNAEDIPGFNMLLCPCEGGFDRTIDI